YPTMLGPHIVGGSRVTRWRIAISSSQSASCCALARETRWSATLASVGWVLFAAKADSASARAARAMVRVGLPVALLDRRVLTGETFYLGARGHWCPRWADQSTRWRRSRAHPRAAPRMTAARWKLRPRGSAHRILGAARRAFHRVLPA